MVSVVLDRGGDEEEQEVWRALANPVRRRILEQLGEGPKTTGTLSGRFPDLSRFAVMQHIGLLVDAGLVVARRRGRERFNHLNPVPLRQWYERWVSPLADVAATELVGLRVHLEEGDEVTEEIRTVRIEGEMRLKATPQKVFEALTGDSRRWFPHTYGQDRVKAIVVEPRVGGFHYEDWGGGAGHLYGQVTVWDPPHRFATRGRVMAGTILDSEYMFAAEGEETVLSMSKVAVGPMSDEEAASIRTYGAISMFEGALRDFVETD